MNPEPRLSTRMRAQIAALWLACGVVLATLLVVNVVASIAYRVAIRAAVVVLTGGTP